MAYRLLDDTLGVEYTIVDWLGRAYVRRYARHGDELPTPDQMFAVLRQRGWKNVTTIVTVDGVVRTHRLAAERCQ